MPSFASIPYKPETFVLLTRNRAAVRCDLLFTGRIRRCVFIRFLNLSLIVTRTPSVFRVAVGLRAPVTT